MEKITMTLDEAIKHEVATEIVNEAHPGHIPQYHGVSTTDGHTVFAGSPDDVLTVSVGAFVDSAHLAFSPIPMDRDAWIAATWTPEGSKYEAWEVAFVADPDAVRDDEETAAAQLGNVVAWAEQNRAEEVAAAEAGHFTETVAFIRGEMADAVVVERDDEGYIEVSRRAK